LSPTSGFRISAAMNLSLSLFDLTPDIQTAWDTNTSSIWSVIPPGQHTASAAIAFNEAIGVRIAVDTAGVLSNTFYNHLLVLMFSPRSKSLPSTSIGVMEPIVHFDVIPNLCG
jgi:hypothetical protein